MTNKLLLLEGGGKIGGNWSRVSKNTVIVLSKYWTFVKLDSTGSCRVETMDAAKTYFDSLFTPLNPSVELSFAMVQRQLWQQMHQTKEAELCLRCYISHQISQVCLDLEIKFGKTKGFGCDDLLPLVLNDEILLATPSRLKLGKSPSYQSLATTILKTFDPSKGSLNTWVSRYVKQYPELKRFLLEHGVFLVSDWALLNDTNLKELLRILKDMYQLSSPVIEQASELLVSYHAVYREDRLQQRRTGSTLPCQVPTQEQLTRIANDLQARTGKVLSADTVLKQLNAIAFKLRQYRITAQGGSVSAVSYDQPEIQPLVDKAQIVEDNAEELEFIKLYQSQFLESLDIALSSVIEEFTKKHKSKRPNTEQFFITALHLFHCQGQPMNEIAPKISLKKQYEVTRFLKLSEMRADIRQKLLLILRSKVIEIAASFTDSQRLENLDKQIELILDEQVSNIIQEAESEVKRPVRNQPLRSLLARRLCQYLKKRGKGVGSRE
jgi:hypothetical protein